MVASIPFLIPGHLPRCVFDVNPAFFSRRPGLRHSHVSFIFKDRNDVSFFKAGFFPLLFLPDQKLKSLPPFFL